MNTRLDDAKQVYACAFISFCRIHVYPDSLGIHVMSQFLSDHNNKVVAPDP